MEDLIREAGPAEVQAERRPMRALSILAALALVVGGVALARNSAEPVTSQPNVVVDGPQFDNVGGAIGQSLGFGAAPAQINIPTLQSIVCPILEALATGPLGGLIGPIINSIRVFFGCISA